MFSKYVFNSKWSLIGTITGALIQIAFWLIAAKHIAPEDIGKISIALATLFFFVFLINWPFNASLIQKEKIGLPDLGGILRLNTIGSVVMLVFLIISSFFLEWFYNDENLKELLVLFMLIVPCDLVSSFAEAWNKRKLNFRLISVISVTAQIGGFVVLLILLWKDVGVFSIAIAVIVRFVMQAILYLTLGGISWAIIWVVPNKVIKPHYDYGKYIIGERLLTSVVSNLDGFLIAKFLGFEILGIYEILRKLISRPIVLITSAVESVAFSSLSKLQNDRSRYIDFTKTYILSLNVFLGLFLAMLWINIHSLFYFLPDSFEDYTKIARLLIGVTMMVVLLNPVDLLLYTKNKTKEFLRWQILYTVPFIGILYYGSQISLELLLILSVVFYVLVFMFSWDIAVRRNEFISNKTYWSTNLTAIALIFIPFLSAYLVSFGSGNTPFIIYANLAFILVFVIFFFSSKKRRELFKRFF